jgi:hypothetical protein
LISFDNTLNVFLRKNFDKLRKNILTRVHRALLIFAHQLKQHNESRSFAITFRQPGLDYHHGREVITLAPDVTAFVVAAIPGKGSFFSKPRLPLPFSAATHFKFPFLVV